jgi:hypothetical protein
MTAGTRSFSGWYYINSGLDQVGTGYTKTWTGTDYPSTKVSYTVTDRHGKIWRRTRWTRDVKRARREEHPYNVAGSSKRVLTPLQCKSDPHFIGWQHYNTHTGNGVSMKPSSNGWTSNDDLLLLGKLREKVAGSDFNLGIFLGEGHQTLRMIGDNAIAIAKALRLARHGKFNAAMKSLNTYKRNTFTKYQYRDGTVARKRQGTFDLKGTTSQSWLELQYGWLPLLQDMKTGAEFLAHALAPAVFRVSARRSVGGGADWIPYSWSTSGIYGFNGKRKFHRQLVAFLKEDPSRVARLSGIMDPAAVAWELVPWSFVIDWAIPIGNYLAARGLASALGSGTYIQTSFEQWQADGPAFPEPDWQIHSTQNAKDFHLQGWYVNRVVLSSLSVPLPECKPLNRIASWRHAANGLALLTGLKKEKF